MGAEVAAAGGTGLGELAGEDVVDSAGAWIQW